MERFQLQSEPRDGAGKGVARKLRMQGRLPAILYGRNDSPMGLSVSEVEVKGILRKHPDSPLVDVAMTDGTTINAIVRDIQRHPASGKLIHIDLQRIRLDEKIRVEVHVHVHGSATGVKEQGGILEHGSRIVNVMCLPTEIPSEIDVDVSPLGIYQSIKVKDIAAAYPNIEFLDDDDLMLATVIPPIVETVATPVAGEEVAATTAEPELIRKPGAEGGEEAKEEKK